MIGPGTTIRGKITGEEDLDVEGRIEGSIRLSENLKIAESATVVAEIEARNVDISGKVKGNTTAAEMVTIDADAVVVGDIATPRLHIADGARFKGRVEMDFEISGADRGGKSRRGR